MKYAISSTGRDLDSPMDPRFGRAAFYIIFDTDSGEFSVLDNAGNANLGQGAGIQSAQAVAEAGAQAIVTGRIGPKAQLALNQAGLPIITVDAHTVREAIEAAKAAPEGATPRTAPEKSGMDAAPGMGQGMGRGMGMGGGGGRGMGGGGRGMGGGGGRGMGGGGGRGMGGGGGRGMGPCGGGMARGGCGRGGGGRGRGMGGEGRGMGGGMGTGMGRGQW